MIRLFLPSDGPGWLRAFADSIVRAFGSVMPSPFRLWPAATADLPAASDYEGGLAWNVSSLTINWSDGVGWRAPQPSDPQLDAIAALTPAANQVIYWTGAASAAMTGFTSSARSLTALDLAQGDLIYASAAATAARLAKDSNASRYLSNGGASNGPAWAQVSLANGVSGVLPGANGGTGNGYFAVSGPAASLKTFTLPNASDNIACLGQAQSFSATQSFSVTAQFLGGLTSRSGSGIQINDVGNTVGLVVNNDGTNFTFNAGAVIAGNVNVGTGANSAGSRSAIKYNQGGWASPAAAGATSSGDKLVFYDPGATYRVTIGMNSSGDMWQTANQNFHWYFGAAPTLAMTLTSGATGLHVYNQLFVDSTLTASQSVLAAGRVDGGLGLRATGLPYSGPTMTGTGVEIGIFSGNGFIQSYNRTSAGYFNLDLYGAPINFLPSGVQTLALSSGAATLTGNLTLSGYVRRSAHELGCQIGGYDNIGNNGAKSNPIYCIGTSYLPTATGLSNMFGIGFAYGATGGAETTFLLSFAGSGWGMYACAGGAAAIFLDATNGFLCGTAGVKVGTTQVLGARRTGWAAATGTATRTSFATSTVTTAQLAERVKALIDDLIAHGAIGA